MAELADAQDLKSWVAQAACGFDSRPRHQNRFYEPWRDAWKAAGIQRLPPDFRRTAARNLERAGVPNDRDGDDRAQDGVHLPPVQHVDQAMLEIGAGKLEISPAAFERRATQAA